MNLTPHPHVVFCNHIFLKHNLKYNKHIYKHWHISIIWCWSSQKLNWSLFSLLDWKCKTCFSFWLMLVLLFYTIQQIVACKLSSFSNSNIQKHQHYIEYLVCLSSIPISNRIMLENLCSDWDSWKHGQDLSQKPLKLSLG